MTEAQREALEALRSIECNMAHKGKTCKHGPWCRARKKVLEAFTEAEMFEVKLGPEYDPTDPYDEGK